MIQVEYELCKQTLNENYYHKIIVGRKGLFEQRNFITDYFNENDLL